MKKLQYLFLGFLLLHATALTAEDIELANGSILQNVKILSTTHESMNVFHDGQIRTIAAEDLSIKARELHLSGKAESVELNESSEIRANEPLFLKYGDSTPIASIEAALPAKVLESKRGWKRVQIEVWVNDDASPVKARLEPERKPPQQPQSDPAQRLRQLKEFDVRDVSVVVTAASVRNVNVRWEGMYHPKTNAAKIVHLQAQFLDRYFVPLITTEEQKLYLSGAEAVSGRFSVSRQKFEMCRYVLFHFGDKRESTEPIEFVAK